MKKWSLLVLLFWAITASVWAQKTDHYLLKNVRIHTGQGDIIEEGAIAVKAGKIVDIGPAKELAQKNYKEQIDGQGQWVYPALIAANTQLGLVEVEAVRATLDFREVGYFNPNIRSVVAYNTDSEILPTILSNGILYSQVVPEGGRISGQSSVLRLSAFNWEDAAVELDEGTHLWWPKRFQFTGWWAAPGPTKLNEKYRPTIAGLQLYLAEAAAYCQQEAPEKKNIKMESMRGLFSGEKRLYVHVDEAKAMLEAHQLLSPYGVKLVFVGAAEAWRIADFLAEQKIPVILSNLHALPRLEHDDVDQPYKTPAILHKKGVKFALSMQGSWNQRNLAFQAGQAVAYGLPKEVALAAITSNVAEILGLSEQIGSLEKGKAASFILSKGDLLDMRSSQIMAAYLDGKLLDLDKDKQKQLYKKYMDKYELEMPASKN
ncbi:amidohydrolase, imidazolonepropionase [Saprospira grandis DSM 2844]|uniref:Amidohydrolase, imidazolonepropionase n=1 Tax=Saprospira grandis DSM 2844 TaxID=694433 RepID=J1I608_9BACT|nr:amidohydrolase family protein [Saprospira grandis]EJF54190.1 amidohydrolase, imidazolonepropionase [Saprospira grandis DSM 2844]